MWKFKIVLFVAFNILVLSGCTLISQKVDLKPSVFVDQSNLRQAREVFIKIEDKRSDDLLGHRGYMGTGGITLVEDPRETFREQLNHILTAKGFNVANEDADYDAFLQLDIKNIVYRTRVTLIDIGIVTAIDLEISAVNRLKNKYSQNYHVQDETRVLVAPPANENENLINQTVSKAIMNIVQDSELFKFLSQ